MLSWLQGRKARQGTRADDLGFDPRCDVTLVHRERQHVRGGRRERVVQLTQDRAPTCVGPGPTKVLLTLDYIPPCLVVLNYALPFTLSA